jgi:hypothetical protein
MLLSRCQIELLEAQVLAQVLMHTYISMMYYYITWDDLMIINDVGHTVS